MDKLVRHLVNAGKNKTWQLHIKVFSLFEIQELKAIGRYLYQRETVFEDGEAKIALEQFNRLFGDIHNAIE